jgi:hypothetical protein
MPITIIQTPASASLSQSPMIFTVSSSTDVTQSQFQYILDLYYWSGSQSNSSSTANYTLAKYPNNSSVGIFDVSRIINSTFSDASYANTSYTKFLKANSYYRYYNGIDYITSSLASSSVVIALDGYDLFPNAIGTSLQSQSIYYPFLTDGPGSQSVYVEHGGTLSVYKGNLNTIIPTRVIYSGSDGNNGTYNLVATTNLTTTQIEEVPYCPNASGFPLTLLGTGDTYSIQAYSGSVSIGSKLNFNIECRKKYPNVRVWWKNRYGQFDKYNFNGVSKEQFNTEARTYQPQLGNWNSRTFGYNSYDTSIQKYIIDSNEKITVNTDWLDEAYNDIFKQLLVSEEIYWQYDEKAGSQQLKPLAVDTTSLDFKTHVVDKLIQYTISFSLGQGFKLIL